MGITEQLEGMRAEGIAAVAAAGDLAALDAVRVAYLGKKGSLTTILRSLGSLDPAERPLAGKLSNDVRVAFEAALEARHAELSSAALEARIGAEAVDVTLPGRARPVGSRHLIEQITAEVIDVFVGLGYKIAEGPEVELDYYNFTALNTPPDHPARSLADTFYVRDLSGERSDIEGESDVLLRTHTSPVQVRVMESQKPPIYILAPGRVYRRDVADPSSRIPRLTVAEGRAVLRSTKAKLRPCLCVRCRPDGHWPIIQVRSEIRTGNGECCLLLEKECPSQEHHFDCGGRIGIAGQPVSRSQRKRIGGAARRNTNMGKTKPTKILNA